MSFTEEKKATRRSRRSTAAPKKEAVVAEAPAVEEKVEEPKADATDSTEEKAGE
jgi:large subunit ribosomal protein L17